MPERERGGQHGDGAVGKVDRGAAEPGFEVERGAGHDVVADVGDVDLELPVAVGEPPDEDGVVEVAGGFAVDGDGMWGAGRGSRGGRASSSSLRVATVWAAELVGFGEDAGGEEVGQAVLADDDFDVDAEVVGVAEDLEQAALGGAGGGGEGGDLDVDGEAFEGLAGVVGVEGE